MDHLGAFGGGTGQGVGRPTVASSRQDEQERGVPTLRQELPQRGERRRVGPVEILDRDDERTAFDERKDEPAERVEHPQLQGLRRLLADLAVDRAEHRLEVRHGIVEITREQRPYPLGHHRRRDRLTRGSSRASRTRSRSGRYGVDPPNDTQRPSSHVTAEPET